MYKKLLLALLITSNVFCDDIFNNILFSDECKMMTFALKNKNVEDLSYYASNIESPKTRKNWFESAMTYYYQEDRKLFYFLFGVHDVFGLDGTELYRLSIKSGDFVGNSEDTLDSSSDLT